MKLEKFRTRLKPSGSCLIHVRRGDLLRVIDLEGQQVADVVAFRAADPDEWLSSGCTLDDARTLRLTTGHTLYSNRSHPMLAIVADNVGRHDFLFAACSREMFAKQYGLTDQPNCMDGLARVLAPLGIHADRIPTPFNVFMNVEITKYGKLIVKAPLSTAGSSILLRAEMDLLVAIAACSAPNANAGRPTPIGISLV